MTARNQQYGLQWWEWRGSNKIPAMIYFSCQVRRARESKMWARNVGILILLKQFLTGRRVWLESWDMTEQWEAATWFSLKRFIFRLWPTMWTEREGWLTGLLLHDGPTDRNIFRLLAAWFSWYRTFSIVFFTLWAAQWQSHQHCYHSARRFGLISSLVCVFSLCLSRFPPISSHSLHAY